ncbi:hypothetical protein GGS21DRAFT_489388 [Xylaria nigripes]|nr:hypothetical protein GGS21DRAFT_489388 [Xylaria nigripes]
MTTAAAPVYYPQYCFHLSPTINTWCPLRAIDIAGLECRPGFEDIDVFFYSNHPIRWVRVTGVVVAIDDYYGHRVYTVDDSTGRCIECTLAVPNAIANKKNYRERGHDKKAGQNMKIGTVAHGAGTGTAPVATMVTLPTDIDVGMTVDVKGSVKLFRGQRQIKIQKITQVVSTNQEVLFWNKIRDFRRDVLSQPWVLKDREVRRCRRLQQVEASEFGEQKTKGKARERVEGTGMRREEGGSDRAYVLEDRSKNSIAGGSVRVARAQDADRKDSLRSRTHQGGKKYDALGL